MEDLKDEKSRSVSEAEAPKGADWKVALARLLRECYLTPEAKMSTGGNFKIMKHWADSILNLASSTESGKLVNPMMSESISTHYLNEVTISPHI